MHSGYRTCIIFPSQERKWKDAKEDQQQDSPTGTEYSLRPHVYQIIPVADIIGVHETLQLGQRPTELGGTVVKNSIAGEDENLSVPSIRHLPGGSAELGNQLSGRQSFGVEMLLVLQASMESSAARARDNKQNKKQNQPFHNKTFLCHLPLKEDCISRR